MPHDFIFDNKVLYYMDVQSMFSEINSVIYIAFPSILLCFILLFGGGKKFCTWYKNCCINLLLALDSKDATLLDGLADVVFAWKGRGLGDLLLLNLKSNCQGLLAHSYSLAVLVD